MRQAGFTTGRDRVCEIVSRRGIVQDIGRTTDPERGVRSERNVPAQSRGIEATRGQGPEPGQGVTMFCHRRTKENSEPRKLPA